MAGIADDLARELAFQEDSYRLDVLAAAIGRHGDEINAETKRWRQAGEEPFDAQLAAKVLVLDRYADGRAALDGIAHFTRRFTEEREDLRREDETRR